MLSLRSAMESTLLEPPLFVSERRDAFLLATWTLSSFSASSESPRGTNVFGPDWEVVKTSPSISTLATGVGSRVGHDKLPVIHYIPLAPSSRLPELFCSALHESFIMQDSAFASKAAISAAACSESPSRRLEALCDLLDVCEEVCLSARHIHV